MERRYKTVRSLVIQPVQFDAFTVTSSAASRKITTVNTEAVRLLSFFLEPRTASEAWARFSRDLQLSERELDQVLTDFEDNRLLLPVAEGEAQPRLEDGAFADPVNHCRMLLDEVRLTAYRTAINKHVRGKRVVDLGAGSGILSILAVRAGASRVFSIEEADIGELARQLIRVNGVEDKIELIQASSFDVTLDESVDIVIHELFGDDPLDENVLLSVNDASRRFLTSGGRLLPRRLRICCCGIEDESSAAGAPKIDDRVERLQARSGINLSPLLDRLHGLKRRRYVHRLPGPILTDEATIQDIDFMEGLPSLSDEPMPVTLRVEHDGCLHSILVFFIAQLDEQIELSTSPRLPKTHWAWPVHELRECIPVTRGERLQITSEIFMREGCYQIDVELSK